MAGSVDLKPNLLQQSDRFHRGLKNKVIKVVDILNGGENGFNHASQFSYGILRNVRFIQEKKLMEMYFDEISHETGKYCFGVDGTLKTLDLDVLETLMVGEELEICDVSKEWKTSGDWVKHMTEEQEKVQGVLKNDGVNLVSVYRMPLFEWVCGNNLLLVWD